MAECDHPGPGDSRVVHGDRIGEYVVQVGSDLAQGPVPGDKIDEAHSLCHRDTGATYRTTHRSGDKKSPNCEDWWSELWVYPGNPGHIAADDLTSA